MKENKKQASSTHVRTNTQYHTVSFEQHVNGNKHNRDVVPEAQKNIMLNLFSKNNNFNFKLFLKNKCIYSKKINLCS